MRLILASDLHLTDKTPKYRMDDYKRAGLNKFKQLMEADGDVLCLGGDIFDKHTIEYPIILEMIEMITSQDKTILYVLGQHDRRYHDKNYKNTLMGLLEGICSDKIFLLDDKPFNIVSPEGTYSFYGSSFGDIIPEIVNRDDFNVLVIHKSVYKTKPSFSSHITNFEESWSNGLSLLRNTGYDLILSGDNHERFVITDEGKTLINPGTMLRNTKTLIDFVPTYYTYETLTGFQEQEFNIEPANDVFDLKQIQKDDEKVKALLSEEFIQKVVDSSGHENIKIFESIIEELIKEEDTLVFDYIITTLKEIGIEI